MPGKLCYSYAPDTREFLGSTEADESPLEPGVYHYPAYTTLLAPAADVPSKTVQVLNKDETAWTLVENRRGEVWYDGAQEVEIVDLGDPTTFKPTLSPNKPPAPPAPTIVAKIDLLRRMTAEEYDAMRAALNNEPPLLAAIFDAAVTFHSDAPEWPTLMQVANSLYTPERVAQLMAPSA